MIAALPPPIVGGELVARRRGSTWRMIARATGSIQTVPGAVHRVLAGLAPGEIVMMDLGSSRDGSTIDAHALPTVIRAVRARAYRFVTLAGVRAPIA